jgi:hypothetical protein
MRLITASNERYFDRIAPYLTSIAQFSSIPAVLICTGGSYREFPGIQSLRLTTEQNYGAPVETESPQHGSFLKVLDGEPDEIIIFTDGDILMQRDFTPEELDWIETLPMGTISAGFNSGPHEHLLMQATMIQPLTDITAICKRWGSNLQDFIGFNVGVFIAHRATYQALYDAYLPLWEETGQYFRHAARQQWLMNWVIGQKFKYRLLPYSFHANGHFGMPPGCRYVGDKVYSGNDLVLFRHKL